MNAEMIFLMAVLGVAGMHVLFNMVKVMNRNSQNVKKAGTEVKERGDWYMFFDTSSLKFKETEKASTPAAVTQKVTKPISLAGETRHLQEASGKPYIPMLCFGCISITAYAYLLTHQELVTTTFTKGGWYAAYPILTAFGFSFIHGAFASNTLSVFGIEAKK